MVNGRGWKLLFTTIALGMVATAQAQTTRCLTKFEPTEAAEFDCGGRGPAICNQFTGIGAEAVFQEPGFSGSTDGVLPGLQGVQDIPVNWSQVVPNTGVFTGLLSPSYEISFAWGDPADTTTTGVRATSLAVANFALPSVHLAGTISFDILVTAFEFNFLTNSFGAQVTSDAAVLMALSIKETGNDVPLGDTDTGSGDLEIIYEPTSEVIPAATNGFFAEVLPGQKLPIGGKRLLASGSAWPTGAFTHIEFDLATIGADSGLVRGFPGGFDGDGVLTSGDGTLDATSNGDGVNRGVLEGLIFTPDAINTNGQYFFIYIDNIVLEAPVDDPFLVPPTVNGPLFSTDTSVTVDGILNRCDGSTAESIELFINGAHATADTNPILQANFSGSPARSATFTGVTLAAGQFVTAQQTRVGLVSTNSVPIEVFEPGVVLADNFDSYTDQAGLNELWLDSVTDPDRVLLAQGSAASCQKFVRDEQDSGSARLYRAIGNVNGTDAEPLYVTWDYKHTGETFGAQFRFELARYAGGVFSNSPGPLSARLPGTTGIIMEWGPATVPFTQTLDEYNILLRRDVPATNADGDVGSNGFFDGTQSVGTNGEIANTGVLRVADVWHRMQIEVKTNTINYYIDGELANPVDTNGNLIAATSNGVPRPDPGAYTHIVIGQGASNRNSAHLVDNVQVTIGTTGLPFDLPNTVDSPTVAPGLLPGDTLVTVTDVDTNADKVTVYVNGGSPVSTNGTGGVFEDGIAVITVPALDADDEVEATQTSAALVESCFSEAVVVGVPAPSVESPLVPGQTSVAVSDILEGAVSAVTIFIDLGGGSTTQIGQVLAPLTDPIAVDVTTLGVGQVIVATQTQTLSGTESPNSAPVTVAVPAVTVVSPLFPGETLVQVSDVHASADLVQVFVNGTTAGFADVSASSDPAVNVTVSPALAPGDLVRARQVIAEVTGPLSTVVQVSPAFCLIVFEDAFEVDSSAAWNINVSDDASQDDAVATFAWDYGSNGGIPPSPNGGDSTFGLRLEANNNPALIGDDAAITVSPMGQSFVASNGYRLLLDAWINANGPFPQGGGGSTQHMTFGSGYDDVTANQSDATATTAAGDGAWFSIDGEGWDGRDVKAYKDAGEQFAESGQFAAGTSSAGGGAHSTENDPFYSELFGTTTTPPAAQALLFPLQTGILQPGSAGLAWHRVDVTTFATRARWSVNGTTIVTIDATIGAAVDLDGNISVGYADGFPSISDEPAMSFGLADNVVILVPHTPGSNGDYDNDGDVDETDAEYFVDCLGGPGSPPNPSTGLTCSTVCLSVFDFDTDDDVDLNDHASFQQFYSP